MQRLILDRPRLPRHREVRACLACRCGKFKCDRSKPRCRRCLTQNKSCVYLSSTDDKLAQKLEADENIRLSTQQPASASGSGSQPSTTGSGRQGDQTIWPNQAGLLAASEDAPGRYYSSASWVSFVEDSDNSSQSQPQSPSTALPRTDGRKCPATRSLGSADADVLGTGPKDMESNVSSLLEIAPLSEIQTLICHFAEFNHLYYPVVDLPEMMAFLRNLRHHDSIPVGSAALIAAMCYQAASSLSCSSEQDPRSGPWSIQSSAWKALSHQLLFASRYPLRPNLNTVRAAILLAVSSIAEWAPDPDPTPIAVLVRAGQALGLHRDPEWFQCSAREADFRRRIWWSIHGIDLTYSMAHGVPPLIHSRGYDVKTQTGHDHDHDGDCKSLSGSEFEALEARKPGNTIDLHLMWSRIVETIYSTQKPTKEIFEKLEAEMTECCAAILDKSDSRRPLREPSPRDEFIAACERMCCHRSVLILHQPYLRSRLWPQTSRAKTLEACKGYIREYTATLTKPTLSAYRWILRHYSVFHMCAIILQDLFQTPHSNESAELLELIERTFAQFSTYPDTDPKWKKLEALRVKAWVANGWVPAAENKKPDNVDAGGGGLDLALGLDLGLDSNASLLEPEWEWDWDPLLASFVWDDSSKQAA